MTIAAPKLTLQTGGAGKYVPPLAEHGTPSEVLSYSGGRGPNGFGDMIGKFSKQPFDPNNCGGPIVELNWRDAIITREGIASVVRHTSRFEADPANAIMIERLQRIHAGQLAATAWDKRYYTHEIREYEWYRAVGVLDGEDPSYEV